MDCAEFKELAALFALGALEGEERAGCEAHLAAAIPHEGCVEALAKAMEGVATLESDQASPPPGPHVWAAIERQISPAARRLLRARRQTWIGWGAALACAAALLFVLWQRHDTRAGRGSLERDLVAAREDAARRERVVASAVQERDTCRARVEALQVQERLRGEAVALLELPGTTLFPLAAQKGGGRSVAANAIMHTGVKRAYVVADGLKPVPDHDYEMWIAKGKHVVPAGVISVDEHGRAVVRIDYAQLLGADGAPDAMMVTLEPRGGSAVVRGPTVLLGSPRS